MIIKMALLFLLYLTPFTALNAMMTVQEEAQLYNKWQQVTKTREFIRCTTLLKSNSDSSSPEYQSACRALQLTKEFTEYKNYIHELES
ncbi:MAG TPA: hypothetical protein VKR54_00140 [Candidatus Babeliales bacterium]|nr:hypothetical protein [Candidatus Babeliales bacterium]